MKLGPTKARELAESSGWLKQTPASFRNAVLNAAVLRTFKIGDPIQRAGDQSGGIHGLLSGRLRVFHTTPERGPLLVHLFQPIVWFGQFAAVVGHSRMISVTAASPAKLLYIPRQVINEVTRTNLDAWRHFAQPLAFHVETAIGGLADLMIRDDTKRFVAVVLRLGGCRFVSSTTESPIIDVSQEDLASLANLARNTAGVMLRRLEAASLIRLDYGRVTIVRQDELRAMLTGADRKG